MKRLSALLDRYIGMAVKAFIFLSIFFPLGFCHADIIILKNGKTIETRAAWEAGDMVKCYRFGAVVGYPKSLVADIRRDSRSDASPKSSPASSSSRDPARLGEYFTVVRVYDGDSLKVRGQGVELMVRLVGIDAPETAGRTRPGQPYGQQSAGYLRERVINEKVRLKSYGMDHYNRQLAELFLDGDNINLKMVESGMAERYQGRPAKGLDIRPYQQAESRAKSQNKGIWQQGDEYISPRQWRKRHRR